MREACRTARFACGCLVSPASRVQPTRRPGTLEVPRESTRGLQPMPKLFVIEDDNHAEIIGEFATLEDAWAELACLSTIPWDQGPNAAPCMGWQTCGRAYRILEYETASQPWNELRSYVGLEVNAKAVAWGPDAPWRDPG
jgi:hypothetical protein